MTVLTARAMPEGTQRRDANEFIEAVERLGAEIHADATLGGADGRAWRCRAHALARRSPCWPRWCFEPAFPADEVDRLRDERLNDLLQAWADPRRRAERVFPETIYAPGTPYSRPLGGIPPTVRPLDRDAVVGAPRASCSIHRTRRWSSPATSADSRLDGTGRAAPGRHRHCAGCRGRNAGRPATRSADPAGGAPGARRSARRAAVGAAHRPRGRRRARRPTSTRSPSSTPSWAGPSTRASTACCARRRATPTASTPRSTCAASAGPFAIRTAVETGCHRARPSWRRCASCARIREAPVSSRRDRASRATTSSAFSRCASRRAGAGCRRHLRGLVVLELPDDELDRYRPMIASVTPG